MPKEELIALNFRKEKDLLKCLEVIDKNDLYFDLPGRQSVVILISDLDFVKQELKKAGVERFKEVGVVSAGDLPPEEAAELRAQYFSGKGGMTKKEKRKRIKKLRQKLL